MEPVRLLRERGIEPHIHYVNPNIAPAGEYEHRRDTIAAWAEREDVHLLEGPYEPEAWERSVGRMGAALPGTPEHRARCRACYRLRFEESARYALDHGYDALGTTLSVSPYQYTDIIREELERACDRAGIACLFEDYSPHYGKATERSRAEGMYRQNYCGCRFSEEEARQQRHERERERASRKAQRAAEREREEVKLAERRAERAAYDAEQARRRAILKELRSMERARETTGSEGVR